MANNEVWRQPYTAQQIQNALTNIIPIIDATTGNWWRWDIVNQLFVDSGVSSLSRYIRSIVKTSTSGLTDTYTITFSDATASTFTVSNGKGILSIVLTGTAGLVDTYTIAFNDGTTQRFDVKNGADGVSPTVTISTVAGGHRVTITDADHPGGQSFDVLDGAVSGDMQSAAYDPNSAVAAAGGIPAYVNANAGVTSFNGRTGAVTPASGDYTAAQVGAIPASQKGAAGGVAELDAGGKVPAAQLPDIYTDADLFDQKISFGLLLNYVRQHEIEAQYGTVTLTNTLAFPFNDSQQTVSLATYMPDTHYAVVTQIKSAVGNPGEVDVFDKLTNGFKLKTTGSAKSVVVDYIVIGGFTE